MQRRPTTQDISWFLDLNRNGQINLNPSYQRRSVWTPKDRKFFLDTIFRNYPCPPIFLHKTVLDNSVPTYHVVDGKQRLETVFLFADNKIAMDKDFGDTMLDGMKWNHLKDSSELKSKFWNYIFTVEFLDTIEGTIVNSVFDRLNRNSRRLERQELRHAQYDGWFITFAEKESESLEWKSIGVVSTARAKRMKDVQFIAELMLVVINESVVGFDQDYLDEMHAKHDNPHENLPDFIIEDFFEKVENTKTMLLEMDKHNSCVTQYAKGFGNFYSLWSVVVLKRDMLSEPSLLAERYADFMDKVEQLMKQDDLEEFLNKVDRNQYSRPLTYFLNTKGASTDLLPRETRTKALVEDLIGN